MREVKIRKIETYLTHDGKDVFQDWLSNLSDHRAKILIDKTIDKISLGNLGKHKSVGEGVQEIVLDHGPGYRIYFAEHGNRLVILLGGSTKRKQQEAITYAKHCWADWKRRALK